MSDASRSPQRAESHLVPQSSPGRSPAAAEPEMLVTPLKVVAESKVETPGPVFRQTARRVPIQQHEADFGVKVSPEKPSYSPRRAYANSSVAQWSSQAKVSVCNSAISFREWSWISSTSSCHPWRANDNSSSHVEANPDGDRQTGSCSARTATVCCWVDSF
ncbi:hypothetical protein NDA16_004607 [Ustilago loliicola]|nr:hypothetical protein NDA16_004607 [Ustilago loliicola]